MKKIIVYYSLEGNTDYVAKKIAEKTGADLLLVEPEKAYPIKGLAKYFHGGKAATTNTTPKLKPYTFDATAYDHIILATPVWARNMTPPLRSFLLENKEQLQGKKFSAYISYRGGGDDAVIAKICELLSIPDIKQRLVLIDPKDKSTPEKEAAIDAFCRELDANPE